MFQKCEGGIVMIKSRRIQKKTCLLLLAFCLLFALQTAYVEAGSCEEGLVRCMYDPINSVTYGGAIYCGIGYLFCKKYIMD
jgi:hypothetical protein